MFKWGIQGNKATRHKVNTNTKRKEVGVRRIHIICIAVDFWEIKKADSFDDC